MRTRSTLSSKHAAMKQPLLWLTVLLAAAFSSGARADGLYCPSSLEETPSVAEQDAPWVLVASPGHRPLEHAGLYLGDPREKAAQVPDARKRTRGSESVTWILKPRTNEEVWLGCSYTGTTAMLFRKIGEAVRECTIDYDLLPTGKRLRLNRVSCR